ncbi:hypothetical protein VPH35_059421 [Triticum aestivum]
MRVSPQPPSPPTVVRPSLKPPSPLAAARRPSILPHSAASSTSPSALRRPRARPHPPSFRVAPPHPLSAIHQAPISRVVAAPISPVQLPLAAWRLPMAACPPRPEDLPFCKNGS